MNKAIEIQKAVRRINRERRLQDLRDGQVQRATAFKPRKGKGSYKRREKYGKAWE